MWTSNWWCHWFSGEFWIYVSQIHHTLLWRESVFFLMNRITFKTSVRTRQIQVARLTIWYCNLKVQPANTIACHWTNPKPVPATSLLHNLFPPIIKEFKTHWLTFIQKSAFQEIYLWNSSKYLSEPQDYVQQTSRMSNPKEEATIKGQPMGLNKLTLSVLWTRCVIFKLVPLLCIYALGVWHFQWKESILLCLDTAICHIL
jgi:hypothetical protein